MRDSWVVFQTCPIVSIHVCSRLGLRKGVVPASPSCIFPYRKICQQNVGNCFAVVWVCLSRLAVPVV